MISNELKAYVTKADGNTVRVKLLDSALAMELSGMGFTGEPHLSEYHIQVLNNPEKAELFERLRDIGVAFSAGREWSPAEVFEYLRETEKLEGSFTRVSWQSPDTFTCTTE